MEGGDGGGGWGGGVGGNPESNETDCCSFSLSLCCLFLTRICVVYRACFFVSYFIYLLGSTLTV